jgi:hypothetical protein
MSERLSRQSFLGTQSDEILGAARVGVIGLGGGGSHIIQQLAHIGVADFVICDPDRVEESNLNRLVGATSADAESGTLKSTVAQRVIRNVNPYVRVDCITAQWQEDPLLLRDCEILFGCVDSYAARAEIEAFCRRLLIPYIDIGMDVSEGIDGYVVSGQVILSMPGAPCMQCLGFLNEDLLSREAARYGAAGGRPQVVWPNGVLASIAIGIFVDLLTPWNRHDRPAAYLEYDGNRQTVQPSNRLAYVRQRCDHFPVAGGVGNPFWPGK